jgi:hypothetical protein
MRALDLAILGSDFGCSEGHSLHGYTRSFFLRRHTLGRAEADPPLPELSRGFLSLPVAPTLVEKYNSISWRDLNFRSGNHM